VGEQGPGLREKKDKKIASAELVNMTRRKWVRCFIDASRPWDTGYRLLRSLKGVGLVQHALHWQPPRPKPELPLSFVSIAAGGLNN
jgi:hypothetical protein